MYGLRSGILHGSDLMQMDQNLDFGWDSDERDLNEELWSITRIALRNWLKNPPGTQCLHDADPSEHGRAAEIDASRKRDELSRR